MSAWTRFGDRAPVGAGPWLVRAAPGELPRLARRAPGLDGYRVTFPPFEGAPAGMHGQYVEASELQDWFWAAIPE